MNTEHFLHALCIWREASGEGAVGMQAVSSVIRNRVKLNKSTAYIEVTRPLQFSAMTAKGDPLLHKYPTPNDPEWKIAQQIAEDEQLVDITNGATHYFNPAVVLPGWAAKMTKVATIGNHDFYV